MVFSSHPFLFVHPTDVWLTVLIAIIFSSASAESGKNYEGVTKSFRTGRLEWELQMIQLSATRYSRISICEPV
jgi:hypothetical protein